MSKKQTVFEALGLTFEGFKDWVLSDCPLETEEHLLYLCATIATFSNESEELFADSVKIVGTFLLEGMARESMKADGARFLAEKLRHVLDSEIKEHLSKMAEKYVTVGLIKVQVKDMEDN